MANTINKLFPFSTIDPKKAQIYPCFVDFAAPIVGGKYVFSKTTTPPQNFGELPQGQTGIIAGVQISANCIEDDFAAGVEKPLMLQVLHGGNGTPINFKPFPFSQFSHGDNFQLQWQITAARPNQNDGYELAVEGEVNQIGNMTSNELILRVTFNFIRVAGSV